MKLYTSFYGEQQGQVPESFGADMVWDDFTTSRTYKKRARDMCSDLSWTTELRYINGSGQY